MTRSVVNRMQGRVYTFDLANLFLNCVDLTLMTHP